MKKIIQWVTIIFAILYLTISLVFGLLLVLSLYGELITKPASLILMFRQTTMIPIFIGLLAIAGSMLLRVFMKSLD